MARRRSAWARVLLSLGLGAVHLVRGNAEPVGLLDLSVEVIDSLPAGAGAFADDPVAWEPTVFALRQAAEVGVAPSGKRYVGRWVGFPSPHGGEASGWYLPAAGEAGDAPGPTPGLVIVHSVAPGMVMSRPLAEGLAESGVAVLVVELPGFGSRERPGDGGSGVAAVLNGTQAAADARRAGDVLAALSGCDRGDISIMGVSLGTFGAATAASLDPFFRRCVLILGGGPAERVFFEGERDAAFLRRRVMNTGIEPAAVRERLRQSDPWHRVDGLRASGVELWLMDAAGDRVFPGGGEALAERLAIPPERRWTFGGNHYTSILVWPKVLAWVRGIVAPDWQR